MLAVFNTADTNDTITGSGNNPMVGMTVAVVVVIEETSK